jgi:hypothetical protein
VAWTQRPPPPLDIVGNKPPADAAERARLWEIIERSKKKRADANLELRERSVAKRAAAVLAAKVAAEAAAKHAAELAAAEAAAKVAAKLAEAEAAAKLASELAAAEAAAKVAAKLSLIQPKLRRRPPKSCGTIARTGPRDPAQPLTRADCLDGPRPCPWNTCRYHLDAAPSCALDIVDQHPNGATMDVVGRLLSISRERVRQIEGMALTKLRLELGPDALASLLTTQGEIG